MIWIGRLVSIPLGLVFFILLLVTLVLLQVNDTFLSSDFYPRELRKANVYEFVLHDLLTAAINERMRIEAANKVRGATSTPLLTSGLSTEEIVASVNRAVPPEWVQGLVEQSFDQFGRYLIGERDEFQVTIRAGDQVRMMVSEIKSLLREADAYNLLYDQVVIPAVEESVNYEFPLGIDVSSGRLADAVRAIAPADWVQREVEAALDEVTPYVVGDRDTFAVRVRVDDRVPVALEEVKALLREADAYELLYSEVVDPALRGNLGGSVELSFGVGISEEEVLSSLRRVAPVAWVQEQAELLIDQAGPYFAGDTDSFTFEVSLVDNKREAGAVIGELVDQRLAELIDGIEECKTLDDARAALSGGAGRLPSCLPPNTPVREIMRRVDIDVAGAVRDLVLGPIPDTVAFDEDQLRSALVQAGAGDNVEQLDQVRDVLRDGWTYTQEDLREDLAQDGDGSNVETLDDVRAFLADGWTYTQADFREDIEEGGDERCSGCGKDDLRILDNIRDGFKLSRQYRWVVYIPLVVLLVLIGFLGGRTWSGRAAWAAAFLIISAGAVYGIFGPGYDSFAKSGPIYDALEISDLDEQRAEVMADIVEDLHNEGNEYPDTARKAANKAFDVLESIADDFASGVALAALGAAFVGLITLGVAIFWAVLVGLFYRFFPSKERELKSWES